MWQVKINIVKDCIFVETSGPNSWKDQFVISGCVKTAVNTESAIIVDLSFSSFSILSLESKHTTDSVVNIPFQSPTSISSGRATQKQYTLQILTVF